jgi:hypothetical protein
MPSASPSSTSQTALIFRKQVRTPMLSATRFIFRYTFHPRPARYSCCAAHPKSSCFQTSFIIISPRSQGTLNSTPDPYSQGATCLAPAQHHQRCAFSCFFAKTMRTYFNALTVGFFDGPLKPTTTASTGVASALAAAPAADGDEDAGGWDADDLDLDGMIIVLSTSEVMPRIVALNLCLGLFLSRRGSEYQEG